VRGNTFLFRRALSATYKKARRLVIGVVGTTVLLIGIFLLVLPGPAFIVIPIGLAILGLEFAWARRLLRSVKDIATRNRTNKNGRSDPG
jgi:tellurite resistance protein TerC